MGHIAHFHHVNQILTTYSLYQPYEGPNDTITGVGRSLNITHVGKTTLQDLISSLSTVLYVPNMKKRKTIFFVEIKKKKNPTVFM